MSPTTRPGRTGRPPVAERALLDTHILLWWQAGGERLSADARRQIERADHVLVSPISIWETGMLVHKHRVALDRDLHAWTRDLFDDCRIGVAALSPQAAATAALLNDTFPGDPADRLLYATALDVSVPLVTKDEQVRAFAAARGEVRTVW